VQRGHDGCGEGYLVVKKRLAQMLKGGVIMDVVTPEHARIAEEAGACAVMALERAPAETRAPEGVARMAGDVPDALGLDEVGPSNLLALVHCQHSSPPVTGLVKANPSVPESPAGRVHFRSSPQLWGWVLFRLSFTQGSVPGSRPW
jgi:hypothetical protein